MSRSFALMNRPLVLMGNEFALATQLHGLIGCFCANGSGRLCNKRLHHIPVNVGQAEIATRVAEGELLMVEAH